MNRATVLAATLALASFSLAAQMPSQDNPQNGPSAQPGNPPGSVPEQQPGSQPGATPAEPGSQASSAPTPESSPAPEMRPVTCELVNKLDTKTAKNGDDVTVQTKSAVTTADGTKIPKGSKLVGHVVAVQASADGQNSQIALKFDHAELAGGQSVPIQSQIQSIGSAEGSPSPSESAGSMNRPPNSGESNAAGRSNPSGSMGGAAAPPEAAPATPSGPSSAAAAGSNAPPAGTVVARTGQIAIQATSIPGVLLANNAPGEQDPRMAQASSVLLGARKDVQLEGGTPVVLKVSTTAAGGGTK